MSHHHQHPRRILTPRKRRETEAFYPTKASQPQPAVTVTANTASLFKQPAEPVPSNQLLAGYMAHEFLTRGTLLGQKFDPARDVAVPLSPAEPKRGKPGSSQSRFGGEAEQSGGKSKPKSQQSYAEVAGLMKSNGAHIPGIVNPTQLARWLQM
ncbi:hypothetical protein RJ639_007413 [Escallonia herrerae]|uniref:Embryo sac development arrest 6 n=1 Tax=Escallonia herrerae TaxID=1293975 RepID=A0AA88VXY1_9ASTE|nr:hypothetical protein RJ639_007413 [Escallonia herrerae]